jgi:hypothetical protein
VCPTVGVFLGGSGMNNLASPEFFLFLQQGVDFTWQKSVAQAFEVFLKVSLKDF